MLTQSAFNTSGTFGKPATTTANPNNDYEVVSPPDDAVNSLSFSPECLPQNYLVAGSWDKSVRCWEVEASGKTIPKSMQSMSNAVLATCWNDDGSKVFMAGCDKQAKMWDLVTNQTVQVAAHDAPIRTCHWIKAPHYSCLMTGSWDKTLKFWDTRSPNPIHNITLPERVYCADVDYPIAVVGTANRQLHVYKLEGMPCEFKTMESPLKFMHRCIAIFRDKKKAPVGFALGSIEGRVAINYIGAATKDNFTFKCHRSQPQQGAGGYQEIYAVNGIDFHPVHGTLATIGSDGTFTFWDKDARTKLKPSEPMDQPVTACSFNCSGHIFAYSLGYDWSMGHEYNNPAKKPQIFLRSCFEDTKPRTT